MRMERAKGDEGRVSNDDVQVIHDGKNQRDNAPLRLICL